MIANAPSSAFVIVPDRPLELMREHARQEVAYHDAGGKNYEVLLAERVRVVDDLRTLEADGPYLASIVDRVARGAIEMRRGDIPGFGEDQSTASLRSIADDVDALEEVVARAQAALGVSEVVS